MLLQLRWLGRGRPAVCAQTQNLRERGPARAPRLPPPAPALSLALPTPRAVWPPPGSLATPRVPSARAPGSRRGGDVRSQGRQAVRGVCVVCVFAALAHKTLDQIRQPGRSVRSRGRNLEVWGSRWSSSGPGTVPARASGCSPEEQNRGLSPVALQTAPVSVEHSGAHHVRGASLAPQAPREGARIAATLQVVRETGVS